MIFSHLALALLPVCLFLLTLLYLDSYKLVRLQTIAELVIIGSVIAALSLLINWILETHGVDRRVLLRFGAPAVEEILKALPLVFLIRTKRIGFLIDAAIFGFAIGTGFALVENLLSVSPDPRLAGAVGRPRIRNRGHARRRDGHPGDDD